MGISLQRDLVYKVMKQTSNKPLIVLQDVSYITQNKIILDKIDLQIAPREILSLVGPNGAGKTTLVKVILGLLPPTQGTVIRQGDCVIGYVPQRMHFDRILPMTVGAFLKLGLAPNREKQAAIVQELGIASILKNALQSISGGELQRVLLARALLRSPHLLVLDEPAQGIDILGQSELYALIARIRDELNCAIVMVSHDLHVVMAQTDNVLCLNQHICCMGTPDHVSRDPAFTALFGKAVEGLAFYTHHHDHHHHVAGTTTPNEKDNDNAE